MTTPLTPDRVHGPDRGVFTDGSSVPNPGPGGWAAVRVADGQVLATASGHHPATTNNRMELTAIIAAVRLIPDGEADTIWTDSQLAVNTLTRWAYTWERNGWRTKTGEVKNVDLVVEAHELLKVRPDVTLRWIRAHVGHTWNEYADRLAAGRRHG